MMIERAVVRASKHTHTQHTHTHIHYKCLIILLITYLAPLRERRQLRLFGFYIECVNCGSLTFQNHQPWYIATGTMLSGTCYLLIQCLGDPC